MLGIGAQHTKDPNGIAWKQNRDFENLLKRLNANSEDPTEDEVDPAPIDGFQRARADEPAAALATDGPETEGRDESGKVKGREPKKKKRPRDDRDTTEMEGRKSKKRKQIESTTVAGQPIEEAGSKYPTPDTIPFVVVFVPLKMQPLTLGFQNP